MAAVLAPAASLLADSAKPVRPILKTAGSSGSLEKVPLCWGHRGASAAFPENTLASFEAAIRDGAEGIETDVHITKDNEIVMFHDPHLDRTTNGTGRLQTHNYHGGLDQLRTNKLPAQKIPTFKETVELLMRKENQHCFLNIDVKVDNEPELLFTLIRDIISAYKGWEALLAPRLVLGLWHPKYLEPAERLLPELKRAHIGMSPTLARKHFWNSCQSFSMNFGCLVNGDGEKFRNECKAAGKEFFVWTVNDRKEMIEAAKWGAAVVLTDKTADWHVLREQMQSDWQSVSAETGKAFAWRSIWYTSAATALLGFYEQYVLEKAAGTFRLSGP